VIPPLSCLLLMFQGPSNVIRKRHDKLLDFDNASKRLGYVKENDQLSSVSYVSYISLTSEFTHLLQLIHYKTIKRIDFIS